MTGTEYSPFIIKPIDNFKCSKLEFNKRYILIKLAQDSSDHCNYVIGVAHNIEVPMQQWRMHTCGDFIKLYWPTKPDPEYIKNGFHVDIIFLKYRTIFKCIIRLRMLKKKAQMRIKVRKNLRIANLFRGIGNSNLNTEIMSFV